MEDLRAYLRSLDVETLADLLHEQAERDPELASRLRLRASAARDELGEVRGLPRQSDGGGDSEATKIAAVLDTLQRMLDAGSQADLAPLARRTADRILAVAARADDPSGALTATLDRAVKLYARACAAHPQQPEQLADWILGVELDHPGRARVELADFAEALGKPGLDRIKTTVDSVLAAAGKGQPESALRRRGAERLREQLAEVSGDVDALLEILSKRLPPLDVSLRIVRMLRAAGRTSEAIAYAAKALAQCSGPARAGVVDELAETFEETGRRGEVLALRRAEFERTPLRSTYLALRAAAREVQRWDAERAAALRLLTERAETDPAAADELVRVLLAEDQPAQAWQAALRYECSLPVKLELAELTENDYPADAIAVYQQQVAALIDRKDPHHYRQAAQRLRKLRALYRAAGRTKEFATYLAELVATHRRKGRLMAELRNARLAVPRARLPR